MTTTTPGAHAPLSFWGATGLVAAREITSQVRTKSFVVSTAILLVAVLASVVVGGLLAGRDPDPVPVAATPEVAGALAAVAEGSPLEPVEVADEDAARAAVRDGSVDAAIVPDATGASPLGIRILSLDSQPSDVVAAFTVAPPVDLLEPQTSGDGMRYLVSALFGAVFMMSAIGFGATIANNTIVEKQTRTVEILLAAVPARALLAGKILGNSALALGQTAAVAAVSVIGLMATGQDDLLSLLGAPLLWFILFFIVGFVLLAAIFAASASLVSRIEDSGSVLMPAMMLTMLPYFIVILFPENRLVMVVASYFPFSAPVAMPVRLFTGDAAWWEPLVSLAVLAVSATAAIAVAARIYRRSLLNVGPRVRLREALAAGRV
ncbi:ABC transporter permease [Schaalia naturae]|uniref:ABC transporter permease n=1 Tax=Schaalia naturae TaxID=635203 RepID=A0ABW2SLZ1_9ACTO